MKNYKTKLLSLVVMASAVIGMTSCRDFLTIQPKDRISEDNFWNEKTDIDQMVAGVYTGLQSQDIINRLVVYGEMRSDNITGGNNYSKNTTIYRILKEDLLSDNPYTSWTCFYNVINKCNIIIARAPEVHEKDPSYTQGNVNATIAEMSAIRALCYFYLVRAFKDVPYYTLAIQSDEDIPALPAVNGDVIIDNLISDLERVVGDAIVAYPKDQSKSFNSSRNRITRSAIYALLADLCLWKGDYAKCNTYCQQVIDRKKFEYEDEYSKEIDMDGSNPKLFSYQTATYQSDAYPLYPCYSSGNSFGASHNAIFCDGNSFESIFELNFSQGGYSSSYIANSALASLFGEYHTKDSNNGKGLLGVDDGIVTQHIQKNYYPSGLYQSERDVRFYTDIIGTQDYAKSYIGKGGPYDMVQVSLSSGSSQTPYTAAHLTTSYDNRNWIFYRLTDVMLMQAEALYFMGGEENLQKAYSLVWIVNRRSIMVNNLNASDFDLDKKGITVGTLNEDIILTERQRELMFEGKRWFDILRKCKRDNSPQYAQNQCPAKIAAGSGGAKLFVNYEALYWPYNRHEVINNPDLEQKSYYGDDKEGSSSLNY